MVVKKRLGFLIGYLLSSLLIGISSQCEENRSENNDAAEIKTEVIYGEITLVDRRFKRIMIERMDISDKDMRQALQKGDYIEIKTIAVYPSLSQMLAEPIPIEKIKKLKRGNKTVFVTESFVKLIKEIEILINNGDKWLSQKAYEKAIDSYKKAITKDVYNIYTQGKNKLKTAEARQVQEEAKGEKEKAEENLKVGDRLRERGNEQEALKHYSKAVERYESAVQKNAEIAEDMRKKIGFAYWYVALAFSQEENHTKATDCYEKAFMLLDSDDADIKKQLGESYFECGIQCYKSGDYSEAYRNLKSCIQLFPSNGRAHNYLDLAHVEMLLMEVSKAGAKKRYSVALNKYKEAIDICKNLATKKETVDIYEKVATARGLVCKGLREKIFLIENDLGVVAIQEKDEKIESLLGKRRKLEISLAGAEEKLEKAEQERRDANAKENGYSSEWKQAEADAEYSPRSAVEIFTARVFFDHTYKSTSPQEKEENLKQAKARVEKAQEKVSSLRRALARNEEKAGVLEKEILVLKSSRVLRTPYSEINWGSGYKESKRILGNMGSDIIEEHPKTQFFIYNRMVGEKVRVGFSFNAANQLNSISQGHFFSGDNDKTLEKVQCLLEAQYGKKGTPVNQKKFSSPAIPLQMWLYQDSKPRVVIVQDRETNQVGVTYYAPSKYWDSRQGTK